MHLLLKPFVRFLFNIFAYLVTITVCWENDIDKQIITVTDSQLKVIPKLHEWRSVTGTEIIPEFFAIVELNVEKLHTINGGPVSIAVNTTILQKRFQLDLKPNKRIIDPNFVALRRKNNQSEVISNGVFRAHCQYQSREPTFAALDICDGLRGILYVDTESLFIIHPLPEHNPNPETFVHVLLRKNLVINRNSDIYFNKDKINYKAHRRKRNTDKNTVNTNGTFECGNIYINEIPHDVIDKFRFKRVATTPTASTSSLNTELYIETAVFIDKDLYNHMTTIFSTNTENELIRFVLALINAVHLLYHDPSLGWIINFVLKRLEILYTDPAGLNRVHDIDKFLSSFCMWQHTENPSSDEDPLHWDHAVILTGLDLYVLSKSGKISNQVVGLAPVAGMCTATSSCTVNEGRHFESAYVVAHEIGHNLGMRHDGPSGDNNCDPSSFLMSPTLGSGKITWSICSKQYLQRFLQSKQSRCLFDKSVTSTLLDHSVDDILPGERFDAHQQCKLKYGSDSYHSSSQPLKEVCKDLQCSKDHYILISHPALEGTSCGANKWCRSGRCIEKGLTVLEAGYAPHQTVNGGWSSWSLYSECASSCIHDNNGDLSGGSIGITIASRRCNNPRPENGGKTCTGNDQKYKTCTALQCKKVAKITINEFSNDVCKRAREVDIDLTGYGQQRIRSDPEEACKVWCHKKGGGFKSRGWSYPDGTVCLMRRAKRPATYCIRGSCKEFTCSRNSSEVIYAHADEFCNMNVLPRDKRREGSISQWTPVSECFYNCISPGTGIRLVEKKICPTCNATINVQTCQHTQKCNSIKTITEHANAVCNKFSQRVRRLSGLGMQLSATTDDSHRPCRLACQDETISHRFYLVNGEEGWFPFGTDCARDDNTQNSFCVNGKCLEFGTENTSIHNFEYFLPTTNRIKRQITSTESSEHFTNQSITDTLKRIIHYFEYGRYSTDQPKTKLSIDLQNPITFKT